MYLKGEIFEEEPSDSGKLFSLVTFVCYLFR